jgi:hypothetical protein
MPRSDWQSIEERIDANRWLPSFDTAAEQLLPAGMKLLTKDAQCVIRGLVRRVFILGFVCRDQNMVCHLEEHCHELPADAQLRWAIDRFESHLKAAELV